MTLRFVAARYLSVKPVAERLFHDAVKGHQADRGFGSAAARRDCSDATAAIAAGLNDAGIPTPRGHGVWSPMQVKRTLEALREAEGPAV